MFVRPFQEQDLGALYAISLMTGHAGGDASHLYRDGRLMGHIYSAPYARLNPDLVHVAADRDGVVGFVAGALDTAPWTRWRGKPPWNETGGLGFAPNTPSLMPHGRGMGPR